MRGLIWTRFPSRSRGRADLSAIALDRTVDLPAVVARVTGVRQPAIDVGALAALDVRGKAVLLHTGDDARFARQPTPRTAHFLTRAGAAWLVDHDAALVGIDALNIDDTADGERPAHTLLLAAGIPVVEHLTGLEQAARPGRRLVHRGAAAHRRVRYHSRARLRPGPRQIIYNFDVNSGERDHLMLLPWPERGVITVEDARDRARISAGAPCAVAGDGRSIPARPGCGGRRLWEGAGPRVRGGGGPVR